MSRRFKIRPTRAEIRIQASKIRHFYYEHFGFHRLMSGDYDIKDFHKRDASMSAGRGMCIMSLMHRGHRW